MANIDEVYDLLLNIQKEVKEIKKAQNQTKTELSKRIDKTNTEISRIRRMV